jgi:hypothetical protein
VGCVSIPTLASSATRPAENSVRIFGSDGCSPKGSPRLAGAIGRSSACVSAMPELALRTAAYCL